VFVVTTTSGVVAGVSTGAPEAVAGVVGVLVDRGCSSVGVGVTGADTSTGVFVTGTTAFFFFFVLHEKEKTKTSEAREVIKILITVQSLYNINIYKFNKLSPRQPFPKCPCAKGVLWI